jgi:hypothetical protein
MRANKVSGQEISLQPYFASRALLNTSKSLKPISPQCFGVPNNFQLIQETLDKFNLCPHQKQVINELSVLHNALGSWNTLML